MRELAAGISGYLAGLPLVLVGMVITYLLARITGSDPSHPAEEQTAIASTWWEAIILFTLLTVWAPIVEETFFRGLLYHHLREHTPAIVAAIISGFLFAAIHPQGCVAIPVLMALGFNFALIREWRGSIIAPAAAHALHNGMIACLLFALLA